MRRGQLCGKVGSHALGHLLKEILAKIKTDPDAVDSDQAYHVLDVIDITINRARFGIRTNENRIYPDDTTALTDDLDLLVADVALDAVKLSHVGVRNDERFARKIDNVLESLWIDVRKIDDDAEALTFPHAELVKRAEQIQIFA